MKNKFGMRAATAVLGVIYLACAGCGGAGQKVATDAQAKPEAVEKAAAKFPDDWVGDWEGRVAARFPGGRSNEFAMRLEVHPTESADRFAWRIIYGEGEQRQVRDYELVVVDADKGHYRVDEKNSIVIDSYYIADALHCAFKVNDALITLTYTMHGDDLVFSLISCNVGSPIQSGAEGDIPEVLTYPVQVSQLAVLKKAGGVS